MKIGIATTSMALTQNTGLQRPFINIITCAILPKRIMPPKILDVDIEFILNFIKYRI